MTRPFRSLKTASELVAARLIEESDRPEIEKVATKYAIAIPPTIAALIDPLNPDDPLARQFVPSAKELDQKPYEQPDPIGDQLKSPTDGIVHRYPDRALLKLVSVCPVYCRFCFRRESVGPKKQSSKTEPFTGVLTKDQLRAALDYLRANKEIWEVIVTGGDPLVLSPRHIQSLNDQLAQIPHIKVVRWHTRVPIVAPGNVTPKLCAALKCEGKAVYIGLHANHPSELSALASTACERLRNAGHELISQTVLLKGVNDDADTMIALMRKLVENRVKPYYLHHTDLAPGTAHFRVSIQRGQDIVRQMRANLSGLAQPTYVLDIPGAHGKVPIGPAYLTTNSEPAQSTQRETATTTQSNPKTTSHTVCDPLGNKHPYNDPCATNLKPKIKNTRNN